MNTYIKPLVRIIAISAFALASCNTKIKKDELATFSIEVTKTEKEIKLHCRKGCSWTDLSFSKNNKQPQLVNQDGMSHVGKINDKETDIDPNDFLFSIMFTSEEFQLKGIKGTDWEDLSFRKSGSKPHILTDSGVKS